MEITLVPDLMSADDGFCSITQYLPLTGPHNQREELPDIIRGNRMCNLLPYDNRELGKVLCRNSIPFFSSPASADKFLCSEIFPAAVRIECVNEDIGINQGRTCGHGYPHGNGS